MRGTLVFPLPESTLAREGIPGDPHPDNPTSVSSLAFFLFLKWMIAQKSAGLQKLCCSLSC